MKLHEFQVGQIHARAEGHGHACAHAARRIGGVQKNLAHAAGGQHRPVGQNGFRLAAFLVEHIGPQTAVVHFVAELRVLGVMVAGQQVDGRAPVQAGDARMGQHLGREPVHERPARVVGPVQDARGRVPALAGEIEAAVRIAVKAHARAFDQHFVHAERALSAEPAHGLAVIVVVPGHQDVFFQGAGVIAVGGFVGPGRRAVDDSPLGQLRIAVGQIISGVEQQHVATGVGQGQGGGAAGHARADDQNGHMAAGGSHSVVLIDRKPPACGLRSGGRGRTARPPR